MLSFVIRVVNVYILIGFSFKDILLITNDEKKTRTAESILSLIL